MANGSNVNVTLAKIRSGSAYFQYDNTTCSAEIKAVQKALYLYGFNPGARDGYYGEGTQNAVKRFQNEKGLPVNGNMNAATLQKLEAWAGTLNGTPTATPSLAQVRNGLDYYHKGDSGSPVTTIRSRLIAKGYSCATSGSYDDALFNVVKNFQSANGLGADGLVGQATLAVLEDNTSDTAWLVSGVVKLTPGKLAKVGFTNIMLRQDIVNSLNAALNTYHINTKVKVHHFLAQCIIETDFGRSLTEYIYTKCEPCSYKPYYGGGMLHLTHYENYRDYKNYKGDTKIIDPDEYATQHVAFAYPGDSAGWYWDKYAGINSINWSDSAYNICNAVTIKVYGNSSQTANRYAQYQKIASVLK